MASPSPKRENLLLTIACNIAIPSLILGKASSPDRLGPVVALVVALAFPLGYGLWDFLRRRQANFISIIGFISVLLTGGLGLAKVDGLWFAIKEAAVPAVIGLAIWASMHSKRPLVRQFFFSDQVVNVPKIDDALALRQNRPAFDRLLTHASYWLIASFLVSAALNFALARWLLRSPSGTPEFNVELAKMNALSWPVIALPTTLISIYALWRLFSGVMRLTGLSFEQLLHTPADEAKAAR